MDNENCIISDFYRFTKIAIQVILQSLGWLFFMRKALFVPECFNWVKLGGFVGGVISKENADCHREPYGNEDGVKRRNSRLL